MRRQLRSLRVRLAVAGFLAIYVPALSLALVVFLSENVEISSSTEETVFERTTTVSPWALAAAVLLAPVAAALAWWWAGRAVRPVGEAVVLQERLIEEASHELRSPLTVLSTNADVLLAHPEPTVELYRQGLERSGAIAQRMAATIQALLIDARGRARTIERRPADLGDLARSVASGLEPVAAGRDVTLRVVAPRPVLARVDQPSVGRAVTNLVTNAIEHAPPGSTVEVVVATADGAAEITVTDKGPGIPPEEQAKIFERYWQGEPDPGNGTGLGLAIVRQIAAAHGGSVAVHSPVNGTTGTQFRLLLTQ